MTLKEFIDNVRQEISAACAIPLNIRTEEIERIIKFAQEWFYKHHEDSVEERFYVIPITNFQTDFFRRTRTLRLPDCVFSVFSLKKLREDFSPSLSFDGTSDLSIERILFKDFGQAGQGSEALMYYVVNLYWIDTASHILNHTVTYNYNRNSNLLFFGGETPTRDCVASCFVKQPLEFLLKDEIFYRYVVASAKMQLGRIMGTFDFTLPGGVKLNYEMLREEGKDALAEIKEEIRKDEGMDFFMTTGGL